jgi:hypothetical protein
LTTVDLQVERVGGATGFLIVFTTFAVLGLLLWIIIALRSACIQKSHKDKYATVYSGVLFSDNLDDDDGELESMIGPSNMGMKDRDIWSHTHRMYFIGENSINYPWFMTRDFPTSALSEQNKERLLRFIKKE